MSMSGEDRRRAVRVEAALKLEVSIPREDGAQESATLETLNISSSGIYFRSGHFIEPMTKLQMDIELPEPDGGARTASCEGIVVRVMPEADTDGKETCEVAVFFTRIDDEGLEKLQTHISRLLEN